MEVHDLGTITLMALARVIMNNIYCSFRKKNTNYNQCLCENFRADKSFILQMAPCSVTHYFLVCFIYINTQFSESGIIRRMQCINILALAINISDGKQRSLHPLYGPYSTLHCIQLPSIYHHVMIASLALMLCIYHIVVKTALNIFELCMNNKMTLPT